MCAEELTAQVDQGRVAIGQAARRAVAADRIDDGRLEAVLTGRRLGRKSLRRAAGSVVELYDGAVAPS